MPDSRPILLDVPDRLVGERVVVRAYSEEDVVPQYEAIQESIEHLRPWMPWYDQHESTTDTRAFVRRSMAQWILREEFVMGIFARDDGRFLGGSGLHAHDWQLPSFEIGYWLRASAEGHGYMTEAVRLVTRFAFDGLRAKRVIIRCDARNRRSAAVAERVGYQLEGRQRNAGTAPDGRLRDLLLYAMIPEDYERVSAS